jgi:hypothetical protein
MVCAARRRRCGTDEQQQKLQPCLASRRVPLTAPRVRAIAHFLSERSSELVALDAHVLQRRGKRINVKVVECVEIKLRSAIVIEGSAPRHEDCEFPLDADT